MSEMKKSENLLAGWREVYAFTWKQGVCGKGFRTSTVIVALLCLIAGLVINFGMAFSQRKDAEIITSVETVYVIDESDLAVLYLDGFLETYKKSYPLLRFETAEDSLKALTDTLGARGMEAQEAGDALPGDVILHVSRSEEGYLLQLIIPYGCAVNKKEGERLAEDLLMAMEQSKLLSSGIDAEDLAIAMGGIVTSEIDAGEEEQTLGEELVSMFLPMICIFVLYLMNLAYGQSVGNVVSIEKSSRLMELLLTLTRPYGLIFGKIFAYVSIAILQMCLWLVCLVGSFFAGDFLAKQLVYSDYSNLLLEIFALLGGKEGSTAFSPGAMALALFTVCLAFLFYCCLAGVAASFASKAEELAQVMSYYQLVMMAGFMCAYLLPLQEKEWINTILRIVPFTGAYLLPGDILAGNVAVWPGILYVAILAAAAFALVLLAGKMYRNQLFYKGSGLAIRLKGRRGQRETA